MKKVFFLVFFSGLFFSFGTSTLLAQESITAIGQCHSVSFPNANVSWAYPSGEVLWKDLEPQRGQYNWTKLDEAVEVARRNGRKIWIQVLTDDPSGPVPDWAIQAGMRQFPDKYTGEYKKTMPVQWDPLYLQFLREIVTAMAQKYDNEPVVEAVLIASGGHYGEMSLDGYNSFMRQKYLEEMSRTTGKGVAELQAAQDTSGWPSSASQIPSFDQPDILFNKYYLENTMKIIDIYAKTFKNKPVVLQVGSTSMGRADNSRYVSGNAVKYAVETYGKKVWLKQNGWGNWGASDWYNTLFGLYKNKTRITREVGHLEQMCYKPYDIYGTQSPDCPSDLLSKCCKRENAADARVYNTRTVNAVIDAGASALCFQSYFFKSYSPTIFPGISDSLASIKTRLEENYRSLYLQVPTPTPTPSGCQKSNGDANNDSKIDMSDYWLWRREFLGDRNDKADFNCDGKVSLADFEIWRSNQN